MKKTIVAILLLTSAYAHAMNDLPGKLNALADALNNLSTALTGKPTDEGEQKYLQAIQKESDAWEAYQEIKRIADIRRFWGGAKYNAPETYESVKAAFNQKYGISYTDMKAVDTLLTREVLPNPLVQAEQIIQKFAPLEVPAGVKEVFDRYRAEEGITFDEAERRIRAKEREEEEEREAEKLD